VALGLPGLYAGDYLCARYRIPGDRQTLGSVQVNTLYAVRQKSGRIEYSLGDTETEPCVRSLFPHLGYVPCWYLRRHATKRIEIGRVDQSKCRGCARGPTARAAHAATLISRGCSPGESGVAGLAVAHPATSRSRASAGVRTVRCGGRRGARAGGSAASRGVG
jgi:hypothetical protein